MSEWLRWTAGRFRLPLTWASFGLALILASYVISGTNLNSPVLILAGFFAVAPFLGHRTAQTEER